MVICALRAHGLGHSELSTVIMKDMKQHISSHLLVTILVVMAAAGKSTTNIMIICLCGIIMCLLWAFHCFLLKFILCIFYFCSLFLNILNFYVSGIKMDTIGLLEELMT